MILIEFAAKVGTLLKFVKRDAVTFDLVSKRNH